MSKITEDDVVKHYVALVVQECKNSYKGLELEDRIAEGTLALIHAIRTYKVQYGCFEEYLLLQLRIIMKEKNKAAWASKRLESMLSLDAPSINNSSTFSVLSNFLGSPPHDETDFEVNYFIENLSLIEKQVVSHLMEDRDLIKISRHLGVSVSQIQRIIENIQNKVELHMNDY
ncbi:sigma-70 RNA polymerase sigma factor region 4 domain-containing protein [Paenibacillus chitinolyticus]|uniref:RNA polymerase subunit sigma-70 n=1 Tax=Paenibacillus chitinolyticus TaxID=79263 RepID=UPI00366FE77E